jgi:hypothetical protein
MKKLLLVLIMSTPCFAGHLEDVFCVQQKISDCNVYIGNRYEYDNFEANVELTFWGEEESLAFYVPNVMGVPTQEYDKLRLGGYEWFSDGNDFKWVITLNSKPPSNVYSFKIDGWEDFVFLYQKPFVNPERRIENGQTLLRVTYPSGPLLFDERPENVDGSYAVYHKTKKNHISGKTNYRTGKVCHIYRPLATDSDGKKGWVDINIDKGVYTATIPQEFLENAEYPVVINDTFGYTSAGGSYTGLSADYLYSFTRSTPDSDGTATSISVYVTTKNAPTRFTLGAYSDSEGETDSKIQDTAGGEYANNTTQWFEQSFDSSFAVSNGTYYWMCVKNEESNNRFYKDDGTLEIGYDGSDAYVHGTLPASFGGFTSGGSNLNYSAYITYTPSGAAAGQVIIINVN